MKRLLRYTFAGGALLLGGCIPLGHGYALSRKIVAAKEGDKMLIADDGAWCAVLPETFATVQPGDEHDCVWKGPDERERQRLPHPTSPPRPTYSTAESSTR